MEKLKEATKTPKRAWKCIRKVFGFDYIKNSIIDEIGDIKISTTYLSSQFISLEEKIDNQIKIVKNEMKKEIDKSKKNQHKEFNIVHSLPNNDVNLNENIKKLEEEKANLSNELSLRVELVNNIGDTILKNTSFENPLKQDIFTILSERLKCNTLIKINNNLVDLVKSDKKGFNSCKVQVDQKDFNMHLLANNYISDKAIDIDNSFKRRLQEKYNIKSNDYNDVENNEKEFSEEERFKQNKYKIPQTYKRLNYELRELEKKYSKSSKFHKRKYSNYESKSNKNKIRNEDSDYLKINSLKNVKTSNLNSGKNNVENSKSGSRKFNITVLNLNPNNSEETRKHKLNFSYFHLNKDTNTYELMKKEINNFNQEEVDKNQNLSYSKTENVNELDSKYFENNKKKKSLDYNQMPLTLLHKNSIINAFDVKRIMMNNSTNSKNHSSGNPLQISNLIIKSISP